MKNNFKHEFKCLKLINDINAGAHFGVSQQVMTLNSIFVSRPRSVFVLCVCVFTPQSVQLLNDVQTTFLQLQAECEKLQENNRRLLESSGRNESQLEVNCQILSSKQHQRPLKRLLSVTTLNLRPGTDHNCPLMLSLFCQVLFLTSYSHRSCLR